MEVGVQRTDSQRLQQNGPRVSFNRDVHVKRIGKQPPNEVINYPVKTANLQPPQQSYQLRKELPSNLSEEKILKEAALVLAQVESVKCTANPLPGEKPAQGTSNLNNSKHKSQQQQSQKSSSSSKFHSLPNRKHKQVNNSKPITRSVSDASAKKSKKPSIFSIFSKKSEPQLYQVQPDSDLKSSAPSSLKKSTTGGKRLERSKSDVSQSASKDRKYYNRRKGNFPVEDTLNLSKPVQLSPIIENTQREDYFEKINENKTPNKEKQKVEKPIKTEVNGENSNEQHKTIIEVNPDKFESIPNKSETVKESFSKSNNNSSNNNNNSKNSNNNNNNSNNNSNSKSLKKEPLNSSRTGENFSVDSLFGSRSTPKDQIKSSISPAREDMHSSQLPPEKPPLTKGVTVDGMVKRLSMERFSPPPPINGPAFSYTRPNEQIIYAQVVCDLDGRPRNLEEIRRKSPLNETEKMYDYMNNNSSNGGGGGYHTTSSLNTNGYSDPNKSHHLVTSSQRKSDVYVASSTRNNYNGTSVNQRSYSPPEITRLQRSSSPPTSSFLNWKQKNLRNLSDEDEGLGFDETRKYIEDDFSSSLNSSSQYKVKDARYKSSYLDYERSKSPSYEAPMIHVRRSVSPSIDRRINALRSRNESLNELNNLSHRRELLESKIKSRRFTSGSSTAYKSSGFGFETKQIDLGYRYSPERSREFKKEFESDDYNERGVSPVHSDEKKYHKLNKTEVLTKYSPERSHLDMVSPTKDLNSSTYRETKYYNDAKGGVKEIYKKETRVDQYGKAHMRESRTRKRLDSPRQSKENYQSIPIKDDQYSEEDKYAVPIMKNLDNEVIHVNRSSPPGIDNHHHHHQNQHLHNQMKKSQIIRVHENDFNSTTWQDSLKRDRKYQHNFDKGDSGIENDFRKESFNGTGEFSTKFRKRTYLDEIKSCELFIRKERRHIEEQHPLRKKYDFAFRERSIDDGSHYDPRLDKYPKEISRNNKEQVMSSSSTYASPFKETSSSISQQAHHNQALNTSSSSRAQKTQEKSTSVGTLERVKKLFSSGRKSKSTTPKETVKKTKSESPPNKDHYMVKEEEMRSRYHEHKGVLADLRESNVPDISRRRRLSTPKASPLLKRSSSTKEEKPSPLANKTDENVKSGKSSWFKSLDRRSKRKDKLSSSFRESTEDEFSTLRSKKSYRKPLDDKNFRFFGEKDYEASASRSNTTQRPRHPSSSSSTVLAKNQKHSHSAYHLDRCTPSRNHQDLITPKSTSLQNLDEGVDEVDKKITARRKHLQRSRELDDISESASDGDRKNMRHISASHTHKSVEHSAKAANLSSTSRSRSVDRDSRTTPQRESSEATRIEFRKPPPGPPKPARSTEGVKNYASLSARERERLQQQDSSGTEGESSLPSQRSVVYLHATTVGAIPQPYHLTSRRRALSREELRSKNKNQPMTRTVSRSVSMLAPWRPKHIHDGYEINYSQDAADQSKWTSTMPKSSKQNSKVKNSEIRTLKKRSTSKDDVSLTNTSKSGVSSIPRSTLEKRSTSKDTLTRKKVK